MEASELAPASDDDVREAQLDAMMATEPDAPVVTEIMGIPLNRIVAFLGPHIAWIAGLLATWLTTNVELLGTFNLDQTDVENGIAQLVIFGLVTGVTWLGGQKWLTGHQREANLIVDSPVVREMVQRLADYEAKHPAGGAYDPAKAQADAERYAGEVPPGAGPEGSQPEGSQPEG